MYRELSRWVEGFQVKRPKESGKAVKCFTRTTEQLYKLNSGLIFKYWAPGRSDVWLRHNTSSSVFLVDKEHVFVFLCWIYLPVLHIFDEFFAGDLRPPTSRIKVLYGLGIAMNRVMVEVLLFYGEHGVPTWL